MIPPRAEVARSPDPSLPSPSNPSRRAEYRRYMLPDDLSAMVRGFQASRIILTAVELNLFTAIGGGASATEVARRLRTQPRGTTLLLNALVALDLLVKDGEIYRSGEVAARYFDEASPNNERAATMHTVNQWHSWSRLTEILQEEPRAPDLSWTESFIAAMSRTGAVRAPEVVKAAGAAGIRRLLDVGGGPGSYAIAFARANPELEAAILDKPDVLPIARRHVETAGLTDRFRFVEGDLTRDDLGEGYDLLLLSNICHMLSPDENRDLLGRCLKALEPGGRVVVQDFILDEDGAGPPWAALFAINMLVATPGGSSYRESEYAAWLRQAGFPHVQRAALPGQSDLIIGRKA